MKVLVTGVNGQLGYDVCRELTARGVENIGVDIADFDITDAAAVENYLVNYHPDVVVHCSAWTAVDAAEDQPEKVMIPLKMHIGAPPVPVVKEGDRVKAGQLIAKCPDGALGSAIHASISGKVVSVKDTIEISSAL